MKTLFDHIPAFECNEIRVTGHAIQRMTERGILYDQVLETVFWGKIIAEYTTDKPFPSVLILYFIEGKAIHVVISRDESSGICALITAYWPDGAQWNEDFTKKIKI